MSLAATSLFGLFIAVFVGINLVSKEVDRRSVYPLFAKPIRRSEFILGKYAGLLLTLLANMAVMTVAIYAVLFFLSRGVPANIQSAWDTPGAGSGAAQGDRPDLPQPRRGHGGGAVFLDLFQPDAVGGLHARRLRRRPVQRGPEAVRHDRRCPGRHRARQGVPTTCCRTSAEFDVKLAVVHGIPVSGGYMASTAAYAALYVAALLFGAVLIFSRRDFK